MTTSIYNQIDGVDYQLNLEIEYEKEVRHTANGDGYPGYCSVEMTELFIFEEYGEKKDISILLQSSKFYSFFENLFKKEISNAVEMLTDCD
jgi:hypothetical protein